MRVQRQSNGAWLELSVQHLLAKGGEARIFALPDQDSLVAKIWHKSIPSRVRKVQIMLAYPPEDPLREQGSVSLAWPEDLLIDGTGRVVGFLMPRITGMRPIVEYFNPRSRLRTCPLFNWRYLLRTARNLATVLAALHQRGYIVGDLNEQNILVADSALVAFVDTDSFQVIDPETGEVFRCRVGRPEYTPPELQGRHLSQVDRTEEHDRFGLGILLFQILMEGTHPFLGIYQGRGEALSIPERIQAGFFPYANDPTCPFLPPITAPPFTMLPPPVQRLFLRCFSDGYISPASRPSAQEWASTLAEVENHLRTCPINPQHVFSNHLSRCPWCERAERLGGWDAFPSVEAVRRGDHLRQDRGRLRPRAQSRIYRPKSTIRPRISRTAARRILHTAPRPPSVHRQGTSATTSSQPSSAPGRLPSSSTGSPSTGSYSWSPKDLQTLRHAFAPASRNDWAWFALIFALGSFPLTFIRTPVTLFLAFWISAVAIGLGITGWIKAGDWIRNGKGKKTAVTAVLLGVLNIILVMR